MVSQALLTDGSYMDDRSVIKINSCSTSSHPDPEPDGSKRCTKSSKETLITNMDCQCSHPFDIVLPRLAASYTFSQYQP